MNVWVWSRNYGHMDPMEGGWRAEIEIHSTSWIKYDGYPSCFFFFFFNFNDCTSWVPSPNKEYYLEVMHYLREILHRKCPELWQNHSWKLHHGNTSAQTSLIIIFWVKIKLLFYFSHRIRHTCPPVTSFCSRDWREPWKDGALLQFTK